MATHEFLTTIDIDVPVANAWDVLVGFDLYPQWCPTHREIRGRAVVGETLRIRLASAPGSDKSFPVTAAVRSVDPGRELAFGGGVPGAPWLFDIHHWFRLESLGPNRCRLHNGERFSGLLLSLLWRAIATRVERGYPVFNAAFKERCVDTQRGR